MATRGAPGGGADRAQRADRRGRAPVGFQFADRAQRRQRGEARAEACCQGTPVEREGPRRDRGGRDRFAALVVRAGADVAEADPSAQGWRNRPRQRRWLAARAWPGAARTRRPRGRRQLGSSRRRTAAPRNPPHADSRSGRRPRRVGALRATTVGHVPQELPPVPALERRAAVRQVRAIRGRTPGAHIRSPGSRRRTGTRWPHHRRGW